MNGSLGSKTSLNKLLDNFLKKETSKKMKNQPKFKTSKQLIKPKKIK